MYAHRSRPLSRAGAGEKKVAMSYDANCRDASNEGREVTTADEPVPTSRALIDSTSPENSIFGMDASIR